MRISNFIKAAAAMPPIPEDPPSSSASEKSNGLPRSFSASDLPISASDLVIPLKSCESMPPRNKASLSHKGSAFGTMKLILGSCELPPAEQKNDNLSVLYEERPLCHLIGLDKPSVVITSKPVDPAVIGYYLGLKGAIGSDLKRLIEKTCVLTAMDENEHNLSLKVIGDGKLLDILHSVTNTNAVKVICHSGSENIDFFTYINDGFYHDECDSRLLHLGTKTGNRNIFDKAQVKYPAGVPHPKTDVDLVSDDGFLMNTDDLTTALARQIESKGFVDEWVVKLNEGVAGRGNARLCLSESVKTLTGDALKAEISAQLKTNLEPFDKTLTAAEFLEKVPDTGVIAEVFVKGEMPASPSYQGFIDILGQVKTVSTHEQILDGQTYKGCKFPADPQFRDRMISEGEKVGQALASAGARGHFGVDFLATAAGPAVADDAAIESMPIAASTQQDVDLYAIEINLRNTGTSYPFTTVTRLTDGTQSPEGDCIISAKGNRLFYTASDYVITDSLKGMEPTEFINAVKKTDIHWDADKETGVVFHLFGLLSDSGRIGATAIAPSTEEADALLEKAKTVLADIGEQASAKVAPEQWA